MKPAYRESRSRDLATLYSTSPEIASSITQLTPGIKPSRTRTCHVPGLTVELNQLRAAAIYRDTWQAGSLGFGFPLDAPGIPRLRGRDVSRGKAVVFESGVDYEYVLPEETETLHLIIDRQLMDELGWQPMVAGTSRISATARQDLVQCCHRALRTARELKVTRAGALAARTIRNEVLLRLGVILAPWIQDQHDRQVGELKSTRSYRLFKRAEKIMDSWQGEETLHIGTLARALRVSERTLYRTFNQWLGIGPYEYFLLRKLLAFRRRLTRGAPYHGKVRDAALATGFDNFSRLSHRYRQHFGEAPRATLLNASSVMG